MKRFEVLLAPKRMNQMAMIYTALFGILAAFFYFSIWGMDLELSFSFLVKLYVLYTVGIILHEAIHAAGFFFFGKAKWDDVKFGFLHKHFVPYVHCKIPLPIRAYRISLLLPVVVTGLLPLFIGLTIGKGILVAAAVMLIAGGIGDWLIFRELRLFSSDAQIQDHESEIGCIVYEA